MCRLTGCNVVVARCYNKYVFEYYNIYDNYLRKITLSKSRMEEYTQEPYPRNVINVAISIYSFIYIVHNSWYQLLSLGVWDRPRFLFLFFKNKWKINSDI